MKLRTNSGILESVKTSQERSRCAQLLYYGNSSLSLA